MMNDATLWAIQDAPVADVEEWAILMALTERCDADGCNAYQSYPTIAERAKVDAKTVYRRCKAMEDRGILKRGDQSVVAHIRGDNRPVVWDLQIPFSWFPNIDRINRMRAEHGKPPLTKNDRPDLGPAPEKKRRKDLGMPREKKSVANEGTSSPVADGLAVQPSESGESDGTHGLEVRPDSESMREGTSSPTTSLGSLISKEALVLPLPPTPQTVAEPKTPKHRTTEAGKFEFPSETENQEGKIKIPRDFWPGLTDWEKQLHAECLQIRPEWRSTVLRKVLGMPQIRERTEHSPELVRRAFLIGANDRKKGQHQGTATPTRMLYDACPHWATAAEQLRAEQEPDAPSVETDAAAESPASPVNPTVPEQRTAPGATVPAPPNAAMRAWQEENAARLAARAEAEARAEEERRRRHQEALEAAGVPVG